MREKRLLSAILCTGLLACLAGCGSETAAAQQGTEAKNLKAESPETQRDEETQDREDAGTAADDAESAAQQDGTRSRTELAGLRLSVVGDSISTYDGWIPYGFNVFYPQGGGVTDVSQTWWHRILDDAGMELCANNSSSGSTCAGDSQAEDIQCGCSSYRLSFTAGRQGLMPNVIVVYMGTNDLLEGIPLGDNDGTAMVTEGNVDNFSDAYCLMLDKLESEYPIAEICCCTLTQIGDWGPQPQQPFVTFENDLGLTAADYSERIRQIAGNRGMKVAELYDCGVEIDNLTEMTIDGIHLTAEGMECVENAVLDALRGGE